MKSSEPFSFLLWASKVRLSTKLALVLSISAFISALATYASITNSAANPLGPDPNMVTSLILINLILILALAAIITLKVISLWLSKMQSSKGTRLQKKIIIMFSLVSVIPTIIVASFSTVFFNFGIQSWFNDRVGTALNDSVKVAEGYLSEHKEMIRGDISAIAADINRQLQGKNFSNNDLNNILNSQAGVRGLSEAIIFQPRKILARTPLSFSIIFDLENLSNAEITQANMGKVVIITSDADDKVRALIKLDSLINSYLFVGRFVDPKIINHTESVRGAAAEYKKLQSEISSLQVKFQIVFIGVAILLLLSSIWFGMVFVGELIKPVTNLINATEKVKEGDLTTRLPEGPIDDEIATLGRAFNRMTDQLEKQRRQLIDVNRQIDERRRFIEDVLSGVSAGILSLSADKRVNIFNRPVAKLLSIEANKIPLSNISEFFPEIESLLGESLTSEDQIVQREITINREGHKKVLLCRVSAEFIGGRLDSYIVTFDDITELKVAERTAAWADVARRIAHEIKNPLTPIHLSAERLRKKYLPEIKNDQESFGKYIDTIIRHVGDIGNMVEEFSQFARMPAPKFSNVDLSALIKDAVFSRKSVTPEIEYEVILPEEKTLLNIDSSQIFQVLTNVLKNSAEAIETRIAAEKNSGQSALPGKISIALVPGAPVTLEVRDNGGGFPKDLMGRLTEPYVTTREKGTGLGLAIVKKIMDDHQGKITLKNTENGAVVVLLFQSKNIS